MINIYIVRTISNGASKWVWRGENFRDPNSTLFTIGDDERMREFGAQLRGLQNPEEVIQYVRFNGFQVTSDQALAEVQGSLETSQYVWQWTEGDVEAEQILNLIDKGLPDFETNAALDALGDALLALL